MGVPNQKKFRHSNSSKGSMVKCKPNAPTALVSPNQSEATKLALHGRAKSGKARILVPPPQIERIKGKYISGMSMRKIAAEEGRDEATVAKIVHMEDMQQYVEGIRRQYWGLGLEAVRSVLKELKKDGWLAHQVLKDIGVVPQQKQMVNLQMSTHRPMTDEEEERAVNELTERIVRATIERHKVFRLPMPQLEQMEDEEKEDDEKDRRPLLERKDD
jgi:hypothetical protein